MVAIHTAVGVAISTKSPTDFSTSRDVGRRPSANATAIASIATSQTPTKALIEKATADMPAAATVRPRDISTRAAVNGPQVTSLCVK